MKNMKKFVLLLALGGAIAAQAQIITWQAPQPITGTSDVSTLGTYFASWAPFDGGANGYPVNGVSFQGFDDFTSLNTSWGSGGQYFGSVNTADTNYNNLLSY